MISKAQIVLRGGDKGEGGAGTQLAPILSAQHHHQRCSFNSSTEVTGQKFKVILATQQV